MRIVTWAVFIASIYFNPLALMVEPAPPLPPTLTERGADIVTDSPVIEEELERMGEGE